MTWLAETDMAVFQIFVDIGDKSWGVMACQRYFGGIEGSKSLHVGDQFLSAGANDFKVGVVLYPWLKIIN